MPPDLTPPTELEDYVMTLADHLLWTDRAMTRAGALRIALEQIGSPPTQADSLIRRIEARRPTFTYRST